ncbi:MAG: hypothetical protein HZB16_14845 [Armatimonadetes bacterium]|nr:hypothetical protein [Armatimonadota bacterium]
MRAAVSDQGFVTSRGRVIAWDQVFYVRYGWRGAVVYTAAGSFRVDRATAEQTEQRIAPWEAERAAWVEGMSPEQRAEWLGLAPGETVTLKANRTGLVVLAALGVAMFLAMAVAAAATRGSSVFVFMLAMVAALFVAIGVNMRWSVSDWVVGEEGFVVRGKLTRWSELRDYHCFLSTMAPTATSMALLSTQGDRTIINQSPEAQQVHRALLRWEAERSLAVPAPPGAGRFYPSSLGRRGIYVNDDGLWDIKRGRAELAPWSTVKGVRWLGHAAEIVLSGGRRITLARIMGGNRLAEAIDQRLAAGESVVDTDGQLRSDVIERWLGVPPGGAIQCRLSQWVALGLPILLLIMLMGLLAGFRHGGGGVAGQIPQFIIMLAFAVGSARSVQADAQGLSIRRKGKREYYAWSEIESIKPGSYGNIINTTRGPVKLSSMAKNQGLIIGIITRILSARAGGAALPDRAPLPETALSRMTGHESVPQDRGLSLSARDEES